MRITALLLLMLPLTVVGQEEEKADIWAEFRFLVGHWEGHESGKAGIGKGDRTYEFVLKDKYLYANNKSVFESQEKNPDGEVHVDQAFLSYDKGRKMIVLREFHGEGFVIQYILDRAQSSDSSFVFVSENIENGPSGMQARVIMTLSGDTLFTETFELAFGGENFSGKEWEQFLKNRWSKLPE